jgi:tRNA(fMet)-specific endonuclease VapC
MKYFLDTNAVIALLKDRPPSGRRRLRRALARGASGAVSSVVVYELWYGVARSQRRRENGERLRIFLSSNIDVVPFDEEDAGTAGELRAALETAGHTDRPV